MKPLKLHIFDQRVYRNHISLFTRAFCGREIPENRRGQARFWVAPSQREGASHPSDIPSQPNQGIYCITCLRAYNRWIGR